MRRVLQGMAMGAALVGSVVLGSGAATAAPTWQSFSTGPKWAGGATKTHPVSNDITFQVCIVWNSCGDAQALMAVVNASDKIAKVDAALFGTVVAGNSRCPEWPIAGGLQRGCFADSNPQHCTDTVWGTLMVNGVAARSYDAEHSFLNQC